MGILDRIVRRLVKNGVVTLPKLGGDAAWQEYLAGRMGYALTANTALRVATVLRCVDVVAKTMASLPLNLMASTKDGKVKAGGHPLYRMLNKLPNPETTAYEFWHMYIVSVMLGPSGAYAKIGRDRNGFITGLWNIPPGNVSASRNAINGERFIDVQLGDGVTERLYDGEFMHTPGLRFSSADSPEDPVRIASEVLGLTAALNGYAKDFFENGSNLGGFVEYPGSLSDTAYNRFKESWAATYSGVQNQHKVAFLEEGAKFNPLGRNPADSQALESRKFQIAEICRVFGVPPHKVFDLDRATFSNIEQQNIEFVQESLDPMAVRLEQTIYKDLLTETDRRVYYAKWNTNGLLRGDIAARTTYYHNARQDGWMNANEIRSLEDMDKIPAELGGDIYAVNGNMMSLTAIPLNMPKGAQAKGGQT